MIKNLLFDLGGVIIDIERTRCVAAFKALGMENPDEFLGDYTQKGPFMLIEEGRVTPQQFRDEIRKLIPQPLTDQQINDAFEEFLIGIPVHRLKALRELRKARKIYLLSNTNPIMWNHKISLEFQQEGLKREDYFDGMVTSFECKCMKPEAGIFIHTAKSLGIEPSETLFLDDSQTNLDAAAALGFQVALVAPGTEFTDIIAQLDA